MNKAIISSNCCIAVSRIRDFCFSCTIWLLWFEVKSTFPCSERRASSIAFNSCKSQNLYGYLNESSTISLSYPAVARWLSTSCWLTWNKMDINYRTARRTWKRAMVGALFWPFLRWKMKDYESQRNTLIYFSIMGDFLNHRRLMAGERITNDHIETGLELQVDRTGLLPIQN